MTDAEIKNLRDLMRAATPGPLTVMARHHGEQCVAVVNKLELVPPNSVELAHCADDAAYIAAVSPDVVLGLIDEVLTSRRRIGALTTLTDAQTARLQSYMNDGAKRAEAINTLASEREANALLTDEIERLRAEMSLLTDANIRFGKRQDWWNDRMFELEQKIEQLRLDAGRYRWLRDVGDYMMPPTPGVIRLDINDHIEHLSGDALDAAIDAAIGEEK